MSGIVWKTRDEIEEALERECSELRAQLEAVTRERDSWRSQCDEVRAEMEEQTRQKREERQAKLDAMRECDEVRAAACPDGGDHTHAQMLSIIRGLRGDAKHCSDVVQQCAAARADAARLREALTRALGTCGKCGARFGEAYGCSHCAPVTAALASTPSAVTREQAERWLSEAPEEPGGMMAVPVAEPSERMLRVAVEVARYCLAEGEELNDADRSALRAIVAKAVVS